MADAQADRAESTGAAGSSETAKRCFDYTAQLRRWEAQRRAWIEAEEGNTAAASRRSKYSHSMHNPRARSIDSETVRTTLSRQGLSTLPAAVPLPQMVGILCDVWEAEGLFE